MAVDLGHRQGDGPAHPGAFYLCSRFTRQHRKWAVSGALLVVLFVLATWTWHTSLADFTTAALAGVKSPRPGLRPQPGPDAGPMPAPAFASIAAGNATADATAGHGVSDAVLHPGRRTLASPDGRWRVRLADDGDLVLETDRGDAWSPVWWTNSGTYKRRNAAPAVPYLTVGADGVAKILVVAVDADGHAPVDQRWDSDSLRRRSSAEARAAFSATPAPQSLVLENVGRLVVFDADSRARCVLYDDTADQAPALHTSVNPTVAEPEPPRPGNGEWPMFSNSDRLSNLQLRAMLERDLASRNQSLMLDAGRLQTIFNTAIVLPSFSGHLEFCVKFLRSMIRHCVDCPQWQINLILVKEDVDLFHQALFAAGSDSVAQFLPGLRIIEYDAMLFEHYAPEMDVAAKTKAMDKTLLQDFKKMYGCLDTGKRHCFLLDSEGIMLRTTWLADIAREFLEKPFAIHSPPARNGSSGPLQSTAACADMLKIDNFSAVGWLLEYYMWLFDARVYAELGRAYAQAWPQLEGNPETVLESCYFAYIWAEKGPVPGPKYRFITSKQLLGQRLWDMMWPRYVYEEGADPASRVNDVTIIEDIRTWLGRYPSLLVPAAEAWGRNKLRLFKAGQDWIQAIAFLGVARSVHMCVSEQPRALYEAAIWGHLDFDGRTRD